MTITSSRTFFTEGHEAVRLPEQVAFGRELDVTIVRSGEVLTIYPTKLPVSEMLARLAALPRPSTVEVRDDTPVSDRD